MEPSTAIWSWTRPTIRRALELWRLVGDNPVGEVRVLCSLAWLAVHDVLTDTDPDTVCGRACALMNQALAVVEGSPEPVPRYELAQNWRQLAKLLENVLFESALPCGPR